MQNGSEDLSPSEDKVDVNLFFSGAQRRKIVEEIKKAIFSDVAVVTITGDEGTGKTMICRMVEKELPANYSCVYQPTTLQSFDDVVQALALGLGTESSKNPGPSQDLVIEIIKHLEDNDRRLVAIFDQSEKMYLATLERIRKMLDQVNSSGVIFHIFLAGRKPLVENLKQLAICNFENAEEKSFSLNPLGLSETYAYLNSSAHQKSPGKGKNVFTPDAAKKIFTMAQGNFRTINMLAEKSLESFDSETSFMVLLEDVHDNGAVAAKPTNKMQRPQLPFIRKRWLAGASALFCVAAVFFYLFSDDTDTVPPVTDKVNNSGFVAVQKDTAVVAAKKNISTNKEAVSAKKEPAVQIATAKKDGDISEQEKPATAVLVEDTPKENDTEQVLATGLQEKHVTKEVESPSEKPPAIAAQHSEQESGGDEKRAEETTERETAVEDEAEPTAENVAIEKETMLQNDQKNIENNALEVSELAVDHTVVKDEISPADQKETTVLVENIEVVTVSTANDKADFVAEEVSTAVPIVATKGEPATAETVVMDVDVVEERTEKTETSSSLPTNVEEKEVGNTTSERPDASLFVEAGAGKENEKKAVPYKREEGAISPSPEVEPITLSESKKHKPLGQKTEAGAKKLVKIAPVTVSMPGSDVVDYSKTHTDAKKLDQLYKQRVAAALGWVADKSKDKHTIQLMVLTSEQAEGNLKKRLNQDEYREIADQLYVIKNKNDSSVFVYYGEYADPDSARRARNTLPIFLRKHNPYVISVENAVKKATSQ